MDRCPHCGGINGWYMTSVVTHRYLVGWDGEEKGEMEAREHRKKYPKRCIDCGRRIEVGK